MAFIYEVNGQKVEFEKEPTDKDIDEAARSLKAAPVSQQQKPVEGSGGAAFGVFRPQGRRPESQQDREASKEMPLQTARGVVTGTLGAPADILNLPGAIYGAVTQQPAPYRIPLGSEEFNQMLPGQSDTPQAKLARFGGEVLAPVPTIKGAKAIAPAAKYAYDLGKDVAGVAVSPVQSAKTAVEAFGRGYANPTKVGGEGSALFPVRETYYPHTQVDEYLKGQRTPLQMSEVPSADITQNSLFNRFATNVSPTNELGQALVAPKGRGLEGYFENLGATYKGNPYLAALDVASTMGGLAAGFGPTPITALTKTIPAVAARQLQRATQFEPNFSAEVIKAAQARSALQPLSNQIPMQPQLALPAPAGPVAPTRTMYVNPEGVATTNVQGTQTNYTPGNRVTPNFATVRTQNQQAAQQSQQLAAQKLQELQKPAITPEQQQKGENILAEIRARKAAGQPLTGLSMPPARTVETPAPAQSASMFESLPGQRWTLEEKLALQKANLQQNPSPAMSAADEASMAKQVAESQKASNEAIINDFATQGNSDKIDMIGQTIPVDMGKDAFNASNATRGMATYLLKNGVDSIPVLPGMTEAQTVHAIAERMKGITRTGRGKPDVLEMKVGKEELPTGISSLSKEVTGEIYASKEAYDKAMLFKTLEEDVPRASYIEGDKLITVFPQNIPKDIIKSAGISPMGTIIRDAKTGKVIKD